MEIEPRSSNAEPTNSTANQEDPFVSGSFRENSLSTLLSYGVGRVEFKFVCTGWSRNHSNKTERR